MDVVLNNSGSVQENSSYGTARAEKRSKPAEKSEDTAALVKSSNTPKETPGEAQVFKSTAAVDSEQAKSSKKSEEARHDNNDSKEKKIEPKEKQIEMSESLLQYKIEENEDAKKGEASKTLVVYLLDKETGEVIRRIPPEDLTDPHKKQLPSKGIFIDQNG